MFWLRAWTEVFRLCVGLMLSLVEGVVEFENGVAGVDVAEVAFDDEVELEGDGVDSDGASVEENAYVDADDVFDDHDDGDESVDELYNEGVYYADYGDDYYV